MLCSCAVEFVVFSDSIRPPLVTLAVMATNPNFPVNLDIKPLHNLNDSHVLESFDLPAQEAAIREYGIAGRVW